MLAPLCLSLCPERDSNPYDRNGQGILSPSCLPIPPSGQPLVDVAKIHLLIGRIKQRGRKVAGLSESPLRLESFAYASPLLRLPA